MPAYYIHTELREGVRVKLSPPTKNRKRYLATVYLFATEVQHRFYFDTEVELHAWFRGFETAILLVDDDAKVTSDT
jgi:hypothetical protein